VVTWLVYFGFAALLLGLAVLFPCYGTRKAHGLAALLLLASFIASLILTIVFCAQPNERYQRPQL
jgi:hypothetical protein